MLFPDFFIKAIPRKQTHEPCLHNIPSDENSDCAISAHYLCGIV